MVPPLHQPLLWPGVLRTSPPWEQGPHTRWAITREILIYEQQNLLTPSLSGEGDVFFLACCRNRGCFEPEAFLSSQPAGCEPGR